MQKNTKRVIALVLTMMMLLSVIPATAFAAIENWEQNNVVFEGTSFGTNGYYNVISKKDYTLVPGAATETEIVLNNANGNRRQVLHVLECDPSNPDISIIPGYYNIDKDITDVNNWTAAGMTDMAAKYENELGYNVVCGMNTALAYDCNAPFSYLVYNGQVLVDAKGGVNNFHSGACQTMLCVYKNPDGTCYCELRTHSQGLRGDEWQAIGANFAMTVNNGELVNKSEAHSGDDAARSMIGVKEDGTLVLVMNDGRGANNSKGFCTYELGESMLALGCKWAFNCDGGGSSGFVTKRAGENSVTMRSVPCDGAERPTINGVFVVSNVGPTGDLNNVNIESDYDYFAPGTSYTFDAAAIDTHGYAMDMPADAAWSLSDASFGTIAADGTFTSNGTLGDVDVQVTVANPDVTDRTVIFTNNNNWDNVKIYCWKDADEYAQWPGTAMTEYDTNEFGQKRFIAEVPEGYDKFIINSGDSNHQTANLEFTGATGIYMENDDARTYDISRKVAGSKTIHVANPTTLNLSATETTLPYSTPEKIRTITLPMVATIGENEVYTSGAYNITVNPANGGTVDGLKFTATDDTSVSQAVVSINYIPTNTDFTYTVNYGKGSEILWDFEDGDITDWKSTADADQYMRDHGAEVATYGDFTTPFKTLAAGGQISWSNTTTTALSSKALGGQAHGGDKALAVTFNMKNVEFNSWVYSIIWNTKGNTVLRDVANGNNATAIGCWVYIPKGFYTAKNNGAQALQLTVQKGPDANTLSGTQLNLQYNGKNINALKESDIPENRWVYVKASLTANNYVKLVDPVNDVYRSCSFIRMYVKPSEAQEMTYYFDDWTLDYSSAVDDREPPVITNPTYCTNDTNIAFDNQTLNTNVLSFDANIADYVASNAEGLDYASAKIMVDGVAVNNVRASGNTMGVQNVVLSNGVHKITFEIADKLGNVTDLSKTITIDASAAKSAVRLAGHNDKNNGIEAGSVYYVDVNADDIEDIDSVTATVELQSAHEWELDHMIVAKGFEASYTLNSVKDNIATITITKTGDTDLTGAQTLVSLPVRVWSYDEATLAGGDGASPTHYTAAQRYATTYGEPVLMMEANVLYGAVTYTDNTEGTFGGSISKATEVTGNKTKAWHEHDAELTVQNKDATCNEKGYENRTYCETCGSVVDWGTETPAAGHTYELEDGKFVCSECGDEYVMGTGIFEMNGKTYYAIAGNLVKGWQTIEGDTYYFGDDYAAVDGDTTVAGVVYHFENNILTRGTWVDDGIGLAYYWAGECYHSRWFDDENGNRYHFDASGHAARGYVNVAQGQLATLYHFDETTGALIEAITEDGIFFTNNATNDIFYIQNGYLCVAGLVQYGNDYYYFPGTFKALKNTSRYIDEAGAHGYVEPGTYYFNADGKLIDPNLKNGPQSDGFFYVNGVRQKCYQVVEWEGYYYFISDGHQLAKNARIYLGEQFVAGTDLTPSYYTFDSEGRIDLRSGPADDGYFYLNGVRQNCYQLIKYNDEYYFINDGHKYAKNARLYLGEQFLAGTDFTPGYYNFNDDGTMQKKNGADADGFFYINGERQNCYQLISFEGNYYFIGDGHKYAKAQQVYLTEEYTEGTDLTPNTYYYFDNSGKMDRRDGPQADGYFYRNGVLQRAYQIVEYNGDYYFIYDGHKIAKNVKLFLGEQFTTGTTLTPGYYNFDADGKVLLNSGPAEDGYFYLNGVRQSCYKLVEFEGNYYFINDGHKYAKNCTLYLGDQFVSGTDLPAGYYNFDENGVLQAKNGPQPDGYFYINSVRQSCYQLILFNGHYYFISDSHKYAVNKRLYMSATFTDGKTYPNGVPVQPGYYNFDAEGKMVVGVVVDGVKNVRDIGGWTTVDGKKIKDKMLIRGGELDGVVDPESKATPAGINTLINEIQVKSQLDLRNPEVNGEDVLGADVTHIYFNAPAYTECFTTYGKATMKEIFTELAKPENYPTYLNCTQGIDRTGSVCYILEAVLGLSEADLQSEYALSIGYNSYNWRVINQVKAELANYDGNTIKEQAANYLLSCGVTQAQIDSIRSILLVG